MLEANERRKARRAPVMVSLQRTRDGSLSLDSPHDDPQGWQVRLGDAFGTRSDTFAVGQLNHLLGMVRPDEQAPEIEANTMLAAVEAVRPENELEGMLAVQMAATHRLAMECLQRSAVATTPEQMTANGNLASKLLRTYTAQIEALAKVRRGGAQKVTVKHVHVHEGGQAIVGNVDANSRVTSDTREGGRSDNGPQPHAPRDERTIAPAKCQPLRSSNAEREAVPVAGREGEGAMPDARRRDRKRSPKR
ncbi:hypothetical protein FOHLNKBM_4456 [Methylobacterium longum]|nr:hypothetical protein FOHLNKBM_4456 [Methylobacterium longum]